MNFSLDVQGCENHDNGLPGGNQWCRALPCLSVCIRGAVEPQTGCVLPGRSEVTCGWGTCRDLSDFFWNPRGQQSCCLLHPDLRHHLCLKTTWHQGDT